MIDKRNTEGMKLCVGGEEVTQDFVKRAIVEYTQKKQSLEYKKELEKFANFLNPVEEKTNSSYKYFRLLQFPYTIFKLEGENFRSYKFNEQKKCWIEFPTFLTDFEYGNIMVEEIEFDDKFPNREDLDLSMGGNDNIYEDD